MTTRHSFRILTCFSTLAWLAAGCSAPADRTGAGAAASDTTAAAAYAGPRACDLLSGDDIARVSGVAYSIGVVTNDYAGDSQCRYAAAGTSQSPVMVTLHATGSFTPYRKVPGNVAVAGLGDAAVWHDGNAQLAVQHGASVYSISFLKPPAKRQWAEALARIALGKLATAQ